MNSESPLVPQGSFLEQKNQGRARVRIAVFVVLAIHCAGVMALLMQGCKKPADAQASAADSTTNTPVAPFFIEPTNPFVAAPETNLPLPLPTNPAVMTPIAQEVTQQTLTAPPATVTDHKIAKGENLGKLAKQYGVSSKAIQDANPGLDPVRMKVDATIRIPAAAPVSTASNKIAPNSTNGSNTANGNIYKVKSGDTLTSVARAHGVRAKELTALNKLKTQRITVGQKLKLPAKNISGAPEISNSTPLTAAPH